MAAEVPALQLQPAGHLNKNLAKATDNPTLYNSNLKHCISHKAERTESPKLRGYCTLIALNTGYFSWITINWNSSSLQYRLSIPVMCEILFLYLGRGRRSWQSVPESDFFKTKQTFQTSFRGKRSILKNLSLSFVTSFRFRLRFIGYPFILKQVENEEKMSCMFLLIFHGQMKSETFALFLKNLTQATKWKKAPVSPNQEYICLPPLTVMKSRIREGSRFIRRRSQLPRVKCRVAKSSI